MKLRELLEIILAPQLVKDKEIPLGAIQQNPEQHSWTTSPKAYCHNYIDDMALGCPLLTENHSRPYVDWLKIEKLLF